MGSSSSQFQDVFSQIITEEPVNTLLSDEIRNLSYEHFLNILGELNLFCKKCLDSNGYQLVFAVKKDTDSTIFWKATVQIACVKINPFTQKVATFRLLTLHEFIKVFKTVKCQILAVEQCESVDNATGTSNNITFSQIFDEVDSDTEIQSECCICFERKQEVVLPCGHSYCGVCIEQWNETNDTCPICREKLDSTDDTWIMSEVPKAEEISKEIRDNLMELTNERSNPCSPS